MIKHKYKDYNSKSETKEIKFLRENFEFVAGYVKIPEYYPKVDSFLRLRLNPDSIVARKRFYSTKANAERAYNNFVEYYYKKLKND
jgi:hypothetical protein